MQNSKETTPGRACKKQTNSTRVEYEYAIDRLQLPEAASTRHFQSHVWFSKVAGIGKLFLSSKITGWAQKKNGSLRIFLRVNQVITCSSPRRSEGHACKHLIRCNDFANTACSPKSSQQQQGPHSPWRGVEAPLVFASESYLCWEPKPPQKFRKSH